jgi:hypothetical protein
MIIQELIKLFRGWCIFFNNKTCHIKNALIKAILRFNRLKTGQGFQKLPTLTDTWIYNTTGSKISRETYFKIISSKQF